MLGNFTVALEDVLPAAGTKHGGADSDGASSDKDPAWSRGFTCVFMNGIVNSRYRVPVVGHRQSLMRTPACCSTEASTHTASMYSSSTPEAIAGLALMVCMLKFTAPVMRLACTNAHHISSAFEMDRQGRRAAYHDEDEELVVVDALEQQRHSRKHAGQGTASLAEQGTERFRYRTSHQTVWIAQ